MKKENRVVIESIRTEQYAASNNELNSKKHLRFLLEFKWKSNPIIFLLDEHGEHWATHKWLQQMDYPIKIHGDDKDSDSGIDCNFSKINEKMKKVTGRSRHIMSETMKVIYGFW